MAVDPRHVLGKRGEDLACDALRRAGYEILARQFRTRCGEIDIIANHRLTVVFVEVKTRRSSRYGSCAEAITSWKRRRIARVAEEFLARYRLAGRPCRFDVAVVDLSDSPRVDIVRGAFLDPRC